MFNSLFKKGKLARISVIMVMAMLVSLFTPEAGGAQITYAASLSTTSKTLYLDGTKSFAIQVSEAPQGSNISISSSDTGVVAVDPVFYTVTAVGVGTATVHVKVTDAEGNVENLSCSVTVKESSVENTPTPTEEAKATAAPKATTAPKATSTPKATATPTATSTPTPTPALVTSSMKLSSTALTMYVGEGTKSLSVKNQQYASVSFSSNKKSVATVTSKGKITAKAVGTAVITATVKNAGKTVKTLKCTVTVKRHAESVGLNSSTAKSLKKGVYAGSTVAVNKTFRKAADGTVVYGTKINYITDTLVCTSSNKKVFVVNKTSGKIVTKNPGTAKLTIYAVDSDGNRTTDKVTYTVKVKATPTPTPNPDYGQITGVNQNGLTDLSKVKVVFESKSDANRVAKDNSLVKVTSDGANVGIAAVEKSGTDNTLILTFAGSLVGGTYRFHYNNQYFEFTPTGYVPEVATVSLVGAIGVDGKAKYTYKIYNDAGIDITSSIPEEDITIEAQYPSEAKFEIVSKSVIIFNDLKPAKLKITITSGASPIMLLATLTP